MPAEQLALARKTGNPVTIGTALRAHAASRPAATPRNPCPRRSACWNPPTTRHELALTLADLGTHLRRAGPPQRCAGTPCGARSTSHSEPARHRWPSRPAENSSPPAPGPAAPPSPDQTHSPAPSGRPPTSPPSGLSNRQIAQHLFITQATVETHLRHAYRKLGITARADLPAQLAGESVRGDHRHG